MLDHEVVQLLDCIGVGTRSNIKHQRELWLDILANCLEEPFVGVDLAIITLFDAEHEVDTSSFKHIGVDPEVPRRNLEAMQQVSWMLFSGNIWIHDVADILHLKFIVAVDLHKILLEENLLIKELLLSRQNFKACRNLVISVTNYYDKEVVLGKVRLWIYF